VKYELRQLAALNVPQPRLEIGSVRSLADFFGEYLHY
jgi:hypothetical protein